MGKRAPSANYDYFVKTNTSAYRDEWLAIAGAKIVAHGKDAQKVYAAAKKRAGDHAISLAKTPKEQMLVLRFSR